MILNKKTCRYVKSTNKSVKHTIHKKIHNSIDLSSKKTHKIHHLHQPIHLTYFLPHYDINIKFVVYNKSSDKPYPGTGFDEEIPDDKKDSFKKLSLIHEWRKKIDDSWPAPFELDGYTWNTVVHYYQANKFKKFPEYYNLFTLEGNSIISKDPVLAIHAGSKEGKINRKKFRPKNVVIDKKYENIVYTRRILLAAQYAKFTQHNDLKKTLLATNDAFINHYDTDKLIPMNTLMRVRDILH